LQKFENNSYHILASVSVRVVNSR